jgi:hypothetical protein
VVVHVPIVARSWQPVEPVHVFATFDAIDREQFPAWQRHQQQRRLRITGTLRTLGGLNYARLFPELQTKSPVVTILADKEPDRAWLVILMVIIGGLLVWSQGRLLWWLWTHWTPEQDEPANPFQKLGRWFNSLWPSRRQDT